MNSLEIRDATVADVASLVPLLGDLGYPTSEAVFKKHFAYFVSQNGYGVAIAVWKESVVGFVAWSRSFSFVSNATRFRIEGILVDKQHRRLGIGKKFMEHVEEIAHSHSPAIIDLTSGKRRERFHEFYKSLGYKNEGPMEKVYLRKTF